MTVWILRKEIIVKYFGTRQGIFRRHSFLLCREILQSDSQKETKYPLELNSKQTLYIKVNNC